MRRTIIAASLVFLFGCGNGQETEEQERTQDQTEEQERTEGREGQNDGEDDDSSAVVFDGLRTPWNIIREAGTFYITEREGNIVEGTDGKRRLPVELTRPVAAQGEGGLLGMVLDPGFADNKRAYVYHSYRTDRGIKNRIVAIVREQDRWKEKGVLLEGIPGGRIHNGGRLEIGPDGLLYATAGDAGNPDLAQDTDSLAGKILRMQLDGGPAEGNMQGYVYSYGHRNPQGLVFVGDVLYASEHGQSGHDEINQIEGGKNYGWPLIEGKQRQDGLVTPWYEVGEESKAPSGIDTKDGKLLFATLVGQSLRQIDLDTKKVDVLTSRYGRIRDVLVDEAVYFITNKTDGRGSAKGSDDRLIRMKD